MNKRFTGVTTALVTPFKDQAVDFESYKRLVRFQLEHGVRGFVVNGTTGESPTLEISEVKKLFEITKELGGEDIPVILGTGSNSTKKTIDMTQKAQEWGADGALVVTPYYNKPPQRGLVAHFAKIAEQVEIPIMLYNVPGRTVVSVSLETILELNQIKNIVGIKEASGDISLGQKIIRESEENFTVVSGDDASCLNLMLAGGDGVISVISHIIPGIFGELCERACAGDQTTLDEYGKFAELNRLLGVEANPIPVKMALKLMGVIDSAEMRLPMVPLIDPYVEELKHCLKELGLCHE